MAELEHLGRLEGSWQATSSLQVMPGEPVRDSHSRLQIKPVIKDKFVQINYDWEDEGQPQEGLLLVGYEKARELATAVWWDSWHMGEQYMSFQGSIDETGSIFCEVLIRRQADPTGVGESFCDPVTTRCSYGCTTQHRKVKNYGR
jgi:hypothetical protein